mgnify:CR=1 FL=1
MTEQKPKHTPGPWTAFTMVHGERGDALTPEEIGEYVKNSVIASAENGGSLDRFLFIRAGEGADARDVCHVGNGPAGPYNAHLIAAAPDLLEALLDMLSDRDDLSEATISFARAAITKATQGA